MRVKLEPLGDHLDGTVTTAMPVVNAIPMVCAAPPGIVNQMELPFVRAAGSSGPDRRPAALRGGGGQPTESAVAMVESGERQSVDTNRCGDEPLVADRCELSR